MIQTICKDLGKIDYQEAWDYQKTIFSEVLENKQKIELKNLFYNTLKIIIRIYHLFLLKPLLVIKTKLFLHINKKNYL